MSSVEWFRAGTLEPYLDLDLKILVLHLLALGDPSDLYLKVCACFLIFPLEIIKKCLLFKVVMRNKGARFVKRTEWCLRSSKCYTSIC